MSTIHQNRPASRRDFLGKLAGTAALIGISNLPLMANAEAGPADDHPGGGLEDPDEWFKSNIKGKHKIVFDAPEPKELMILQGSAHAQFLFQTDQGERLMKRILEFLSDSKTEAEKK